jgi:hypothetical protein
MVSFEKHPLFLASLLCGMAACVPRPTPATPVIPSPMASPTSSLPAAYVTVDDSMIVREGPGYEFPVKAYAHPGTSYPVLGEYVEWVLIDLGEGTTGWVYGGTNLTNFGGRRGGVPILTPMPSPTFLPTATCAAQPPTPQSEQATIQRATDTIRDYFQYLSHGQYASAATLYGGSYEVLREDNPLDDPFDFATLLAHACEINGFQCLTARSISLVKSAYPHEFQFSVELQTREGELFVRGQCCGASATDMPDVSQFVYTVIRTCDDSYVVLELPPYVP